MITFKIIKSLLIITCLLGLRFAFADGGTSSSEPTDCKADSFAEQDSDEAHCSGLRASNKRVNQLADAIADTDLAKRANITAEELLQDPTTLCRIKERVVSCNGRHGVPWDKFILADFQSRQSPGEPDPRTEAGTGCQNCSDKDRAIAELKDINDRLLADRKRLEHRLEAMEAAQPPPGAVVPPVAAQPPPPPPPPPVRRDSLADTLNDPKVQLGELLGRMGLGPGGMQMPPFGQYGQSPFGQFGQQPFGQPISPYGQPAIPYFAQMPQYMRPITPAIPVGGQGFGFGASIGGGIGLGGGFGGIGGGLGAGIGGPTGITPPVLAPYIH